MPDELTVMARPRSRNREKLPYNALLYDHMAEQGVDVVEYDELKLATRRWSVLHLHWPESLLEMRGPVAARWSAWRALALIDWARHRGTRVLWTAHDLRPHDYVMPALERPFWSAVMQRLDGVIGFSASALDEVLAVEPALRRLPAYVIRHGHFRGAYRRDISREEARRALGIPADVAVIGFFGQVRPYKNLPLLIRRFREMALADAVLLIAGRTSARSDEEAVVRAAAAADPRIHLHLGFVPNNEVQQFLLAADLVALPFRATLNSGSALLALSFDRPILVPHQGSLRELAIEMGAEWVRSFEGELTASDLRDATLWAKFRPRAEKAPLDQLEWAPIAAQTIAAYRSLCAL